MLTSSSREYRKLIARFSFVDKLFDGGFVRVPLCFTDKQRVVEVPSYSVKLFFSKVGRLKGCFDILWKDDVFDHILGNCCFSLSIRQKPTVDVVSYFLVTKSEVIGISFGCNKKVRVVGIYAELQQLVKDIKWFAARKNALLNDIWVCHAAVCFKFASRWCPTQGSRECVLN